jgi:hypothetical protein
MQHPFAGSVGVAAPVHESSCPLVPGTMIFAVGVRETADLASQDLEGVVAGLNKGGGSSGQPSNPPGGGGNGGITTLVRTEEGGGRGTPIGR